MISKLKKIVVNNKIKQREILGEVRENNWSSIYHDSIKGIPYLEDLPLNIGRWAGGYSFFYILNRVLKEYKPAKILEMGLGESSKFISVYLDNYLYNTEHYILEQDKDWAAHFNKNFQLSKNSRIVISPLTTKIIKDNNVKCYEDLSVINNQIYNLYVIDGPFGSINFSRFEIVELSKGFSTDDEFIIIMDDYNRVGEQNTIAALIEILNDKKITFYSNVYSGKKEVFILGTEKYKHVQSF